MRNSKKSSVYLDHESYKELANVMRRSRAVRTQNAAIVGVIARYSRLLDMQASAEEAGKRLVLGEMEKGGDVSSITVADFRL